MTHPTDRDHEPHHAASSTASLLTELQLFGHRPFQDEPDSRPLPDPHQVGTALHAKHQGMVLLHGGSPKGAERIAACWADTRKVPQIAFKPDFTRHKNAAPFKRNDQLLDVLPIGVVVFPGSGISDNLADKAKKLGIPVLDDRKGGGG